MNVGPCINPPFSRLTCWKNTMHITIPCCSSIIHNHINRIILLLLTLLAALPIVSFLGKVVSLATYIADDIFYAYRLPKVGGLYDLWISLLFLACCMILTLNCASRALDAQSFPWDFSLTSREAKRFLTYMFSFPCFKAMENPLQVGGNLAMIPSGINASGEMHPSWCSSPIISCISWDCSTKEWLSTIL